MSKYGKRILAAGMCVTMTMGMLTGCSSSHNEIAAKVDGTTLTLGEANFMLRYSQVKTQSYLGALFGEGANVFQQDLAGNGQAYGETVKESVMEDLKEMAVLEQHMGDYNIELTEEEKSAIEEAAKEFLANNDEEALKAMSATEETVARVLTLYTIQSKMENAIKADVDTEVSDEEAAQKSIQYVYFSIPETESETEETSEEAEEDGKESEAEAASEEETEVASEAETTEETEAASEAETIEETEAVSEEDSTEAETEESAEKKETRATVQGIIDAVLAGETLEDAVKVVDEEKTITDYSYGADDETLNENLKAAAETLSDGEIVAEPVESENGFYIVQMVTTFDREATDAKKEDIIEDREQELYESVLADWEPESFEINEKVWSKVTFEDIFTLKSAESETEAGETEETASEEVTEAESDSETGSEEAVTETETDEAETVSETEAVSEEETETEA